MPWLLHHEWTQNYYLTIKALKLFLFFLLLMRIKLDPNHN